MSLTNRIKQLADEKNVTIAEIERKTGISNGQIRRWDSSSPKIENIQKVADFFNVSTDYLIGRSKNPRIDDFDGQNLSSQIMFRMNTEGLTQDEVDELKTEVDRFLRFRKSEIESERNVNSNDKA
ncbi:helix-turn-helix domain-containing protein [Enterococcus rivorum]|uniref:Transcriptional regulator n=1 Tax=Enterococcus rivorum TaxID=762845 RepID=A0A1E5KYN7_9ENTE|nr:helix-turn-helix transcriptional regulator [Enterococcus rivorum]MBP2099542.1 transcriptional regulator with XRE-family HTH domain [Enterococcus rivorum]OEH82914.1 transcriptional regulator [Enterococcus rivorum]